MAVQKRIIGLFICISLVLSLFPIVNSYEKLEVVEPDYKDKVVRGTVLSNDNGTEVK